MSQVAAKSSRLLDELTVAYRHPSLLDVEVVLESDANIAAHRDRRRDKRPLVEADADHLPMRTVGQAIDLVHEVARGAGNAAQHPHDEAELHWRFQHAHVDE